MTKSTPMRMWATKYVLTRGIERILVGSIRGVFTEGEYVYTQDNKQPVQYRIGTSIFHKRLDARDRAIYLRDRRVASLQKQIAQLRVLTFEMNK